jgi:hypothetical protein
VLALRGLARSELIRLMSILRCNWSAIRTRRSEYNLINPASSSDEFFIYCFPELPVTAPSVTEDRGVCAVRSG